MPTGTGPVATPAAPTSPMPKTDCRIKGNISRSGERIHYLPGTRFYEQTQIDTAAGERMFCSEQEAQAAGWRAAR